jgi:hypothetical protein
MEKTELMKDSRPLQEICCRVIYLSRCAMQREHFCQS